MYKSKLLVLCQRNLWQPPEYSTSKDGPDHNPRFTATVTINGLPFQSSDQNRTAKEAQNNVAKVAFDHFSGSDAKCGASPNPTQSLLIENPPNSSVLPTSKTGLEVKPPVAETLQPHMVKALQTPLTPQGVKDNKNTLDSRHLYKNRLQNYAQKRNLTLPEYSCERQGPPHASRFKSKVTIDGQSYESPEFFSTMKEAENAAAKVACELLSLNEAQEEEFGLYKNLLQELAPKGGFLIPNYETVSYGPPHMPTFVSTVVIGGQAFQGQAARSKKLAEMNAAKLAYEALQGCNSTGQNTTLGSGVTTSSSNQQFAANKSSCDSGSADMIPNTYPDCQIKEALKVSSSILKSVISSESQQNIKPEAIPAIQEEQDEECQELRPGTTAVKCETQLPDPCISQANEEVLYEATVKNAGNCSRHASPAYEEADISAKRPRSLPSCENVYPYLRDPFPSTSSSPEYGPSSLSGPSAYSTNSSRESNIESPGGVAAVDTKPCEKILVCPQVPNMTFPDNATVLPCSDDKWVALKMDTNV